MNNEKRISMFLGNWLLEEIDKEFRSRNILELLPLSRYCELDLDMYTYKEILDTMYSRYPSMDLPSFCITDLSILRVIVLCCFFNVFLLKRIAKFCSSDFPWELIF